MTLSDIYNQVHRLTGRMARTRQVPDVATEEPEEAILCDFVREACLRIGAESHRLEFEQKVGLLVGTSRYTFPTDWWSIYRVRLRPDRDLVRKDFSIVTRAAEHHADGEPSAYSIFGEYLDLDRKVSQDTLDRYPNLTVHGTLASGFPSKYTGDVVSVMPPEFEQAIVRYVLGQWYTVSLPEERALAQTHLNEFDRLLLAYKGNPRASKFAIRNYVGI